MYVMNFCIQVSRSYVYFFRSYQCTTEKTEKERMRKKENKKKEKGYDTAFGGLGTFVYP